MVTLSNCNDHTTHTLCSKRARYKNILSVKTGLYGTVTAASSASRNLHKRSSRTAHTRRRRKTENACTLQTVGPCTQPVISCWSVECMSPKLVESHSANRATQEKKSKKKQQELEAATTTDFTTSIHISLSFNTLDTKLTLLYGAQHWKGSHVNDVSVVHCSAMRRTQLAFLEKFLSNAYAPSHAMYSHLMSFKL